MAKMAKMAKIDKLSAENMITTLSGSEVYPLYNQYSSDGSVGFIMTEDEKGTMCPILPEDLVLPAAIDLENMMKANCEMRKIKYGKFVADIADVPKRIWSMGKVEGIVNRLQEEEKVERRGRKPKYTGNNPDKIECKVCKEMKGTTPVQLKVLMEKHGQTEDELRDSYVCRSCRAKAKKG